MAAVIDVSTILTYSIGGLPMTVLQSNESYKDTPIMWVNAKLGKKSNDEWWVWIHYYNTYDGKNISLCDVRVVNWLSGSYIVWREEAFVNSWQYFEQNLCSIWAWPYKFKDVSTIESSNITWYDNNQDYKKKVDNYFWGINSGVAQQLVSGCYIIPLDKSKVPKDCIDQGFGILSKGDGFFTDVSPDGKVTIDSLLEKSKWFVGPFITIYSSLLDYTSIVDEPWQDIDVTSAFFMLLIKVLFAAALFFPLLALAVVLLVRIWVLWLAIAAIPIIILFAVFKNVLGGSSGWIEKVFPWFSLSHLIKLIFAPVFVVFAISMSMIFLTALGWPKDFKDSSQYSFQDEAVLSEFGMEKIDMKTYSIFGLIEFELDQNMVDEWLDTFAWFITKLFAVWIIWFFVFAAVKATVKDTKLWKTIGDIQWWIEKAMGTLPIIPFPWGGIWVSAAKEWLDQLWKNVGNKALEAQTDRMKEQFPWLYPDSQKSEPKQTFDGLADWTINKITTGFAAWSTANEVWNDLGSADREALEKKGITDAWWLSAAYNTYVTNNVESMVGPNKYKEMQKFDKTDWFTNADAQTHTSGDLNSIINWDKNWKAWAGSMLWWAVHTKDWVYVMDNIWTPWSPVYRLVKQNEYEQRHFGESFSDLTDQKINSLEWDSKKKYDDYKSSVEQMKKEYDQLKEKEKEKLSEEEKDRFKPLEIFVNDFESSQNNKENSSQNSDNSDNEDASDDTDSPSDNNWTTD